jgi:hypothetical protein
MTYVIGRGRYARAAYPVPKFPADDHTVLVNINDTAPGFLETKVIPGFGVLVTPVDLGGGILALSIAANVPPGTSDHKVLVDGADTTPEFLGAKLVAGAAIALSILNPGGNEQVSIAVSNLANAQVAAGAGIEVTKLAPGSDGQVLVTATGAPGWAQIVDANVAAGAAILGTKISPNFGSQNITTTGNLLLGPTPRSSALGLVRVGNNVTVVAARNAANSNDISLLAISALDVVSFGSAASLADTEIIAGTGSRVVFKVGASQVGIFTSVAFQLNVNELRFAQGQTAPVIEQTGTAAAPPTMVIRAQGSSGAAAGGRVQIHGGEAGTGPRGSVVLALNTTENLLAVTDVAVGRRAWSFGGIVSSGTLPSGDKVGFQFECDTVPTSAPVGGIAFYVNGGQGFTVDTAGVVRNW